MSPAKGPKTARGKSRKIWTGDGRRDFKPSDLFSGLVGSPSKSKKKGKK